MSQVKRHEIAGRKVIFYTEDLFPSEPFDLEFQASAQYQVRAQAVTLQIYSCCTTHWRGKMLGGSVDVAEQ